MFFICIKYEGFNKKGENFIQWISSKYFQLTSLWHCIKIYWWCLVYITLLSLPGDVTDWCHCDGWLWTVSWIIFALWRPGTAHSLVSHPSWAGSNWGGIRLFILYSNYHGHSALQTSHHCACAKLSLTWLLVVICSLSIKILTTSRLLHFSVSTSGQFRGGGGG